MQTFKLKSGTVKAVRFVEGKRWPAGVYGTGVEGEIFVNTVNNGKIFIHEGDWIVRFPRSRCPYVFSNKVFRAMCQPQ